MVHLGYVFDMTRYLIPTLSGYIGVLIKNIVSYRSCGYTILMQSALFSTPEEYEYLAEAYFTYCDMGEIIQVARKKGPVSVKRAIPYTKVDLALWVGLTRREDLDDLCKDHDYLYVVARSLARIEGQRIRKTLLGEQEGRMAQFDLKNNSGYKDVQTHDINITSSYSDDELQQRIALLERKMLGIGELKSAPLIDGKTGRMLPE